MSNDAAKNSAPGRRTGRPLKLADDRTRQRLFNVLRAGDSRTDAATKLGVSHQTIKNEAQRAPTFLQIVSAIPPLGS